MYFVAVLALSVASIGAIVCDKHNPIILDTNVCDGRTHVFIVAYQ